jgi:hypothetical protein
MKSKPKKNKFFEAIKAGLEDAIAHSQGKLKLRTCIIEIPEPPQPKGKKLTRRLKK